MNVHSAFNCNGTAKLDSRFKNHFMLKLEHVYVQVVKWFMLCKCGWWHCYLHAWRGGYPHKKVHVLVTVVDELVN